MNGNESIEHEDQPLPPVDVRTALEATTPRAGDEFRDTLEARLMRDLEARPKGLRATAPGGASTRNGWRRVSWAPVRALAPVAGRFGSAFVMLLMMAALVAGLLVVANTRSGRSTNAQPTGDKLPMGITPTPPPGALAGSALEMARYPRPVLTITTPLLNRESLSWSPDGALLASASQTGTITLWDASTGQKLRDIDASGDGHLIGSSWSPPGIPGTTSGSVIASHYYDNGTVKLWDPASGKLYKKVTMGDFHLSTEMVWSPDGRYLAWTDGWDVKLWDTGAESVVPKPQPTWPDPIRTPETYNDTVSHIAWSPDGKELATSQVGIIKIWDPLTGQELASLANSGGVLSMAWAPHAPIIATTGGDAHIMALWNSTSGKRIREWTIANFGYALAWSPQGDVIATGDLEWADSGESPKSSISLYDPMLGQTLNTLDGEASDLAWSPDGRYLAAGNAKTGEITIWGAKGSGPGTQTPGEEPVPPTKVPASPPATPATPATPPQPTEPLWTPAPAGVETASPATISETETPTAPDATGTPFPVPAIDSGGLGLTRDAWEKLHGPPSSPTDYGALYENHHYGVTFDERGVIKAIRVEYGDADAVDLQSAEAEAQKLLPRDAIAGGRYEHDTSDVMGGTSDPHDVVQLYKSDSLSKTFSREAFYLDPPGTCSIQYEEYKALRGKVRSYLVELSQEP
ncbi:MAG: WD40 repeat domain-containing protein [Chloroflexia bacterium]